MHILVVNHRDWLNPRAGGVEEVVYQTTTRWAKWGHTVHLLVSDFPGAHPRDLTLEGVHIVRRGREELFNWFAPWYVRKQFREADVIVEHLSKVACMLPWWTRKPVVGYYYHFFNTSIFGNMPLPIAAYVVLMEKLTNRVYRHCPSVVISKSTTEELIANGVPAENLHVVYCGLQHDVYYPAVPPQKTSYPSVLWVGRVRKIKGVNLIVEAFEKVVRQLPAARLRIIGKGDYEADLRRLIAGKNLQQQITMTGYLEQSQLREEMQRAWVLAYPSPKEGWGLCVIEAAACGTPAVASDSPGLRESVHDGEAGFLVPHGDIAALTEKLLLLLSDEPLRQRMSQAAVRWAANFSWDQTGQQSLQILQEAATAKK